MLHHVAGLGSSVAPGGLLVISYRCRLPVTSSPAWFYDSGQFSLGCKHTKANPANAELSQIPSGSATNLASVI